ncbi:glycoside hydrolase family 92 protein [Labilibacter sediminis]|nr:glycoside hydrolase family 92 protein [Labilibacter sediminis]
MTAFPLMLILATKGEFKAGVDPTEVVGECVPGADYTESNTFHYLFYVQYDISGLMQLMGDKDVSV